MLHVALNLLNRLYTNTNHLATDWSHLKAELYMIALSSKEWIEKI